MTRGPTMDPLVSVATSTYNRPEALDALLGCLEKQTIGAGRFEVVVADNASSEAAAEKIRDRVKRSHLDINLVRLDINRGACAGRNAAWRAARSPVVAFTDDDCHPTPQWLEEGLRTLEGGPAVLIGATEPHPGQLHLLDPMARTMRVRHAMIAPTCNAFYLYSDLEAVDGFDEAFGAWGGEDTDLAWRVHAACGRPLSFGAKALVYHDVRKRTFREAARETARWEGVPRVVARHPEMARKAWHRGYFFRSSHPRALLAAAGLAAAPLLPLTLLLTAPWLRRAVFRGRPSRTWLSRARFAPALFGIDLLEILVLARGSIRHRALLL